MRKWILFLLLVMHGTAMATRLEITGIPQQVVLGLPVEVEIRATAALHSLDRLDLTAWQDNFIIRRMNISSSQATTGGKPVELMQLRLYARHAGHWRLPALQLDGAKTRPFSLRVLPQHHDDVQIKFISGLSQREVLVRQELYLWVEVYTSSNIDVRPERFSHPYVHADEVIVERKQLAGQALPHMTRFSWPLLPLKQAGTQLQLPLMTAGGRRLFQLAPVPLEIRPLADFMPVAIPVSRLVLEQHQPDRTIWLQQPASWKISVKGTGMSQQGLLQQLSQQLRSTAAVRFYAPEVILTRSRLAPYTQQAEISIPFIAEQTGRIQLPELRLAYVEPASGKLGVLRISSATVTVRHEFWYPLQKYSGVLLLAALCLLMVYFIYVAVKRYLAWRHWYNRLAHCGNDRELLQQLLHPPLDTCLLPAQNFRQWQQLNTARGVRISESFIDEVQLLQSRVWGRHQPGDFSRLKQQLLSSLPTASLLISSLVIRPE